MISFLIFNVWSIDKSMKSINISKKEMLQKKSLFSILMKYSMLFHSLRNLNFIYFGSYFILYFIYFGKKTFNLSYIIMVETKKIKYPLTTISLTDIYQARGGVESHWTNFKLIFIKFFELFFTFRINRIIDFQIESNEFRTNPASEKFNSTL